MSAELARHAQDATAADYGVCPECGARFLWTTAYVSELAHQVIAAVGRMPSRIASWIPLYLGMFRNVHTGGLPFPQQRTVVDQLEPMIVSERVHLMTASGMISKPASVAVWARGFEIVVAARNKPGFGLPLTSNTYLLKTVMGLAEKQPLQTAAVAMPSGTAGRVDPVNEVATQFLCGAIPREHAESQLRTLGLDPNRIAIMLGVP